LQAVAFSYSNYIFCIFGILTKKKGGGGANRKGGKLTSYIVTPISIALLIHFQMHCADLSFLTF